MAVPASFLVPGPYVRRGRRDLHYSRGDSVSPKRHGKRDRSSACKYGRTMLEPSMLQQAAPAASASASVIYSAVSGKNKLGKN